ncbi:hypothetical protein LSAT2_033077 [Lamellibrachia satsuma]|nr:hypothetical protein LSAT2_033077 [Lamellibrachia satsuma]
MDKYLTALQHYFVSRAWQQWGALRTDQFFSPTLLQSFKRCYRSYSPATEELMFPRAANMPMPFSMSLVKHTHPDKKLCLLSKPSRVQKLPSRLPPCPSLTTAATPWARAHTPPHTPHTWDGGSVELISLARGCRFSDYRSASSSRSTSVMSWSPSACDAAEADPGEETAESHPADRPGDSETEHTTDKNEEGETSLAEDTIVPVEWRETGGCWPNKYKKKATEEFQSDQPINVQLAVGFASSPMSVTASDNHDDIFHPVNRALKAAREATVNEARFHVPKQQTEDKCTSDESEIGSEVSRTPNPSKSNMGNGNKTPPTNSSSAEQEPSISPVVRRTEESCSPGDGKKSDVCSEFSDDHMSPGSEVDSEVRPTTWQTEVAPPDLDHNDEHHEQSDATLVDGDSEAPEIVTHTVESDVYSEFGDDNMFDGSEVDSEVRPTTWQTEGAPPDNDESSEQSDSTIAEHDLELKATRHLICGSCSNWVDLVKSGCEKSWAEVQADSFSFECRGCTKMKELEVELEELKLIVVAMVGREQGGLCQ